MRHPGTELSPTAARERSPARTQAPPPEGEDDAPGDADLVLGTAGL